MARLADDSDREKHERVMDVLKHTFLLPVLQIIVDRLPRRQIVRQQSPYDACATKVEDSIDQLPRRAGAAALRLVRLELWADQLSMYVGWIGLVAPPLRRLPLRHWHRLASLIRRAMNHNKALRILLKRIQSGSL